MVRPPLCRLQIGRALGAARSPQGIVDKQKGTLEWSVLLASPQAGGSAVDEPHQQEDRKRHHDKVDHSMRNTP
jgi:hypothetical protein